MRRGSWTIRLSLSPLGTGTGRSGERAGAAAAGGGGLRASGGDGAFCGGGCPSMPVPENSAKRNARATSDTLSERFVTAWFATRSRPEWNDGDFGIPSGETARRGFVSAAVNIAREGARATGPAWTIAGGGRQRHPSGSPAGRDRSELRGRPHCHAPAATLAPLHVRAHTTARPPSTLASSRRVARSTLATRRAPPPAHPHPAPPSIQPPLGLPRQHTLTPYIYIMKYFALNHYFIHQQ